MPGVAIRKFNMTADNLKVFAASLLGFGAPGANWFIDVGEPAMKVLVLAGQFGVAVATIVYISFKCRQLSRGTKPKTRHNRNR